MPRKPRPEQTHSEFLPYLMNRVVGQINAPMQLQLRQRGLTMTHWRVLGFLCERDGLIISELADRTLTDQATLSRALDRLQARGLIQRRVAREDSRRIEVHLCAAGRVLNAELARCARLVEDWAFAGMSADELEQLHRLLSRLSGVLTHRAACAPTSAREELAA